MSARTAAAVLVLLVVAVLVANQIGLHQRARSFHPSTGADVTAVTSAHRPFPGGPPTP